MNEGRKIEQRENSVEKDRMRELRRSRDEWEEI